MQELLGIVGVPVLLDEVRERGAPDQVQIQVFQHLHQQGEVHQVLWTIHTLFQAEAEYADAAHCWT